MLNWHTESVFCRYSCLLPYIPNVDFAERLSSCRADRGGSIDPAEDSATASSAERILLAVQFGEQDVIVALRGNF